MPATKRGVYHNLRESKYTVSNSEIVFFFSSNVYKNKFLMDYKKNREKVYERLEKTIGGNPLNVDMLADIELYRRVEKRGFFVRLKGAKINIDGLYLYALRRMTERTSLDWSDYNAKKATT